MDEKISTPKIQYTEGFKNILKCPEYMIQGFYYRFGVKDIVLGTDNIEEAYFGTDDGTGNLVGGEKGTASVYYQASSMIKYNNEIPTINITIKINKSDNKAYKCLYLLYVDLMNDNRSNKLDDMTRLAGVMTPFSAFNFEGNNILNLNINPLCDLQLINPDYINHIEGSDIDKSNIHEAVMKNQFLEIESSKDYIYEDIISRNKMIDSFIIKKSGLIEI